MAKRKRVVVTGLGVVSSIGIGWRDFWASLIAGKSGISEISYIDTQDYPTHFGGEVKNFDSARFIDPERGKRLGRGGRFGIAAVKMAFEDAGLRPGFEEYEDNRVGLCLGTTMADIQSLESTNDSWLEHGRPRTAASTVMQYPSCSMSSLIAGYFNLKGPNRMIPTACAAGNYAISYAADLLRQSNAELMVAGGVDPFSRIAFTGFNRLFALSPDRCRPFDKNRQGTIVGEGAGILILETLENARARGAHIYAEVLGAGLSCDGKHMTIPSVEGVTRVMANALKDAGVDRKDVDYISAHGTGTPANDKTESAAIRNVFGSDTDGVAVSSIKSMLGHTMGAASALEAIACVLAIRHGAIPPTINFETPDPECNVDCVPNVSRRKEVRVAMNNSFAFGGNNACVLLGR